MSKRIFIQTAKLPFFDNCTDIFEEKPRQFLKEIINNETIRNELANIIDKSPLFSKNKNNVNAFEEIQSNPEEISGKKIEIVEEGEKLQKKDQQTTSGISLSSLWLYNQSVFSDLNASKDNINTGLVFSTNKFNALNVSRKKKTLINDEANAGILPPTQTTVWETVTSWIMKAVNKIKQSTSDFFSFLSKNHKNLLIEFGVLILGIALLFTSGIITNPTSYFSRIFNNLLSYLGY